FADNNALESLDGIENTTILEEVSLSGNQLVNVNNLENSAETLRVLNLSDNKLTDLSLLSVCKNLTKFSANNNSLVSLEFLSECASLSNASANGNLIESTKGLKGVLTNVSLSGNKLTSVEGLTFDTDYSVYVDFSDNDITSLELPKDCKYNVLNLKDNAFADNAFYEGLEGYTIEIDYFEELSSELLKELDFSTINLYECPANRKVEFETAAYKIKLS
ncbi:MAG: hypothetical protein IKU45_03555, partial [Clostridia bacterium]|nr:hypothetical protein [Clostridia bacterium]